MCIIHVILYGFNRLCLEIYVYANMNIHAATIDGKRYECGGEQGGAWKGSRNFVIKMQFQKQLCM